MQTKKLQKIFPKGTAMPEALAKLCEFTTQSRGRVACDFELTASGKSYVEAWFRDDPAAAKQFIIFGTDKPQSLYGYWLHDECSIDSAPIVYLGSEGTENSVLANSLEDFLGLLALGHEEIGLIRAWDADTKACDHIEEYRAWLKNELKVDAPADDKSGRAIVNAAVRKHPKLSEWIKKRRERISAA